MWLLLFWKTVFSLLRNCNFSRYTFKIHTNTLPIMFHGNYLVSYLMSTNIYCEFHQTMLFFLFLNNLTASHQQGKAVLKLYLKSCNILDLLESQISELHEKISVLFACFFCIKISLSSLQQKLKKHHLSWWKYQKTKLLKTYHFRYSKLCPLNK